jgi:hypothetical protein
VEDYDNDIDDNNNNDNDNNNNKLIDYILIYLVLKRS